MITKEHDGIDYNYIFERGQQWVEPNGTMRWCAVFQVQDQGGNVKWLHELSGTDELPFIEELEAML